MSQDNVEVVRRSYQAFNEEGLPGASAFWDREIVWSTDPMVPEPGVYTGFEKVRTYLEGFVRAFGAWHIDIQELIDLGGDEVLSVLAIGGRPPGQTAGETRFLDWAWLVSVRDCKITQVRSFLDKDRAFEAAGLEEQAVSQENVEIVRALIDGWNANDRDLDRISEYLDPSIELTGPLASISGEPYRGFVGVGRWMRDLDEQFDEWAISPYEVRQVGERVLALTTVKGRGRASGATLEFASAAIIEFTGDHRVERICIYPDVHAALKTVGLE